MNREQFLALAERKEEIVEVEIPDYGTFRMRKVPEAERVEKYEFWLRPNGSTLIARNQKDVKLKIISLCLVGDDGQPFLTDADFGMMRKMWSGVISRLVEVAAPLCGLSDDDIEDKVKKKADNSSETTDDSST